MRIPFKISAESVKNHDETRSKIFGFIHFEEHARDNTGNRVKKAIKQGAVIKEESTEILIDSKNAVAVLDINKFKGHRGSAVHGVFVTTGRAKTTMTAEGNKFKLSTMRTAVHGTTKRRIATVDHFIDVLHLGSSGMKSIFNFFVVVSKDLLQNVHTTIM